MYFSSTDSISVGFLMTYKSWANVSVHLPDLIMRQFSHFHTNCYHSLISQIGIKRLAISWRDVNVTNNWTRTPKHKHGIIIRLLEDKKYNRLCQLINPKFSKIRLNINIDNLWFTIIICSSPSLSMSDTHRPTFFLTNYRVILYQHRYQILRHSKPIYSVICVSWCL